MLSLVHWIVEYVHERGVRIDRPEGNNMVTLLLFHQPLTIWQHGQPVRAPENSCIIFLKGAPQLYYSEQGDYSHDGVFLDGDGEEVKELLCRLALPVGEVFRVANPKAVAAAIRQIAAEALLHQQYSPQILDCLLRALLYKTADLLHRGESLAHTDYAQMEQLRQEVLLRPQLHWEAAGLSRELHISLSRFQHLYKEFFGTSLMQDVIQGRIETAKYLLRAGHQTIAEVASRCGYNNVEHFMRQFRQWTGVTPGRYRRAVPR